MLKKGTRSYENYNDFGRAFNKELVNASSDATELRALFNLFFLTIKQLYFQV